MRDRNDEVVEGPEKNKSNGESSLGAILQPLFLARKNIESSKSVRLYNCVSVHSGHGIPVYVQEIRREKGRKGRGGFSRLQYAVISKKSNPIVEQTMRRLRMMIQMWWCVSVSACHDKVYVACVSL
jgi:hypothetical protein